MKKVYLVYAGFYYKDGTSFEVMLNLFASEKKAATYLAFKQLSFKYRGGLAFGDSNIVSAHLHISCESICTYDWSDDLKNLQEEKSNLLEFV